MATKQFIQTLAFLAMLAGFVFLYLGLCIQLQTKRTTLAEKEEYALLL